MRYRRVAISGLMLIRLMTEGHDAKAKCIKGLPEGTEFVDSHWDVSDHTRYGLVWLVIEHESFDLLKEGDLIPIHPIPEFEAIR